MNDIDLIPTEFKNGRAVRYEVVRDEPQARVEPLAPIVSPLPVERVPRVQYQITGSPVDEAQGFNMRVSSLAAVLAGGVVLAALVFGATFTFWTALMWFGSVFAGVWLLAFVWDTARSPWGIELVHTLLLWRFLEREQVERHRRMGAQVGGTVPAWVRGLLLSGAVGFMGLFVLLVLAGVAMEWMPR